MTTYEEWLTVYPDISDPNFSGKIASMAEFAELAGTPAEKPVANGQFYPHQKLFRRLFDEYSRALVIDAPGTGKTCLFVALAELYRQRYTMENSEMPSFLQPPRYNRVYVITRGKLIGENFENELVCRCTKDVYEVPAGAPLTISQKWGVIKKKIKEYYTRYTYVPFANLVASMNDDQLRDYFNGSIIVVDEGHNIIPTDNAVNLEMTGREKHDKQRTLYVYQQINRLAHTMTRGKVIILTATPTRYSPIHEIGYLINILRPEDDQMPINMDMTMEEFGNWVNGYVTYVRELDNGVDLIFKGNQIEDSTTIVDNITMSNFQTKIYADAYIQHGNRKFYTNVREAGNIVYPDESYGSEGNNRYIQKIDDSRWAFTDEMLRDIQKAKAKMGDNFIRKYSAKFFRIAQLLTKYYQEGKKGFVYQEFKKSGAIPLGLFLEEMGVERFYSKESAFVTTVGKSRSICTTTSNIEGRKLKIQKGFRYGLLIPDNSVKINETMIELFNSPENRYGEYIALLIFSPHGKEGMSVFDIQWMAQVPTWLWPPAKQSIYRGRRVTSQLMLLNDAREKAIQEGRDPLSVRLNLNVHLLAAIPNTDEVPAVDIIMYTSGEDVARMTAPYITKMRSNAIDCFINYNRNVLPGDKELEGLPLCDYGSCFYECDSEPPLPPDEWDYSGLLRKYTHEYREPIMKYLQMLAQKHYIYPLHLLISDLVSKKKIKKQVILIEIYNISRQYDRFLNRMGQYVYLHISGGYIVFSTDFPYLVHTFKARQLSYYQYISSFPWLKQTNLEDIVVQQKAPEVNLATLTVEDAFASLEDAYDRPQVLEQAIKDFLDDRRTDAVDAIVDYYKMKIYEYEEPLDEIRNAIKNAKKSKTKKPGPIPPEPPIDKEPETVYMHTLQSQIKSSLTRYNYASNSRSPDHIRIFSPATQTWRDANWIEVDIYRKMIAADIDERELQYGRAYGIVTIDDPENQLRLIYKKYDEVESSDSRTHNRGKVCTSWSIVEILPFFYITGYLEYLAPQPNVTSRDVQEYLIMYPDLDILRSVDELNQRRIVHILIHKRDYQIKTRICPNLYEYLETQNLIAYR